MQRVTIALLCAVVSCAIAERFYIDGVNESNFNENTGVWTDYMNRDMPAGTGEFEDITEQRARDIELGQCKMFCDADSVTAMDVVPANSNHNWAKIDKCTKEQELDPSKGYVCQNVDQWDTTGLDQECFDSICDDNDLNKPNKNGNTCGKCPNVKVRYFCTGNQADLEDEYCTHLEQRRLDRKEWEQNQKKRMLEEIAQEKKREHKETTLAKLLREMIKELE